MNLYNHHGAWPALCRQNQAKRYMMWVNGTLSRLCDRTPFFSTMRSTKAPDKPALINSQHDCFWRQRHCQYFSDLQNLFCFCVRSGFTILFAVVLVGFGGLIFCCQDRMNSNFTHQNVLRTRQPLQLAHGKAEPCEGRCSPGQPSVNEGFKGNRQRNTCS
jgi:hypothetical protein